MNIKIATRRSMLAQVQTESVMKMIKDRYGIESEKLMVETEGDRKVDVSLDKIGGKGLFVKDIEIALLEGRAHAAVHSMKDVPFDMNEAFEMAAIPVREDIRDAFISSDNTPFVELPKGARVGTSSNRRAAQLRLLRPDIEIVPIRGNVQTRIGKIEKEKLHGVVLASAGLKRLGLDNLITEYFDPERFLPAVGQGAIGIEILRSYEEAHIFRGLDNQEVRICVEGERSFMRRLNGGCHTALGAYATIEGNSMYIIGTFSVGDRLIKKDIFGDKWDYLKLGETLAEKILSD